MAQQRLVHRDSMSLDPYNADIFSSHESLLTNELVHCTTPEAFDNIANNSEWNWRGVVPETERESNDGFDKFGPSQWHRGDVTLETDRQPQDGFDKLDTSDTMRSRVPFELRSVSDQIKFPFSRFPKSASPGSDIKILSVDASILLSSQYSMYYVSTIPSQSGPGFSYVMHTNVIIARVGSAHEEYAKSRQFKQLDKRRNRVLWFTEDNDKVLMANNVTIGGHEYTHRVHVSFLGGLSLAKSSSVRIENGTKLQNVDKKYACPAPQCEILHSSLFNLKSHYLAKHTNLKLFACEACDRSFAWKKSLVSHMKTHKDPDLECIRCDMAFTRKSALLNHVLVAHRRDKMRDFGMENNDCGQCEQRFSNERSLIAHSNEYHGGIILGARGIFVFVLLIKGDLCMYLPLKLRKKSVSVEITVSAENFRCTFLRSVCLFCFLFFLFFQKGRISSQCQLRIFCSKSDSC